MADYKWISIECIRTPHWASEPTLEGVSFQDRQCRIEILEIPIDWGWVFGNSEFRLRIPDEEERNRFPEDGNVLRVKVPVGELEGVRERFYQRVPILDLDLPDDSRTPLLKISI